MQVQMLSVEQAATEVGISRSLLYELWKSGKGPNTIRIKRRRFVSLQSLHEWIASLNNQAA